MRCRRAQGLETERTDRWYRSISMCLAMSTIRKLPANYINTRPLESKNTYGLTATVHRDLAER